MSYPVKCKNCGVKWLYVSPMTEAGTVFTDDIQTRCPACGSNWSERITDVNP